MRTIRFSDIQIQNKKQPKRNANKTSNVGIKIPVENTAEEEETTICACFGKIHVLHATCIKCGRLICEKEKYFINKENKCLYCGFKISLAEINDNEREDECNNEKNRKEDDRILIPKSIISSEEVSHYIEAVQIRDRLIDYSRNTNRMRVIDEELDWYSEYENQWNTKEERLFALKMSNEYIESMSKRKTMINIDIENGKVVMDDEFQARNSKYYSDKLDEFETRRIDEGRYGDNNKRLDNIVKILEEKLNISCNSELCTKLRNISERKLNKKIDEATFDFTEFLVDDMEQYSEDE
ncbi:hypothetical protein FG386_003282 [Cryptosporidium ryanae]|uniref:uncharacterized protein n=1 Tax=Cryptosporidium ryanae TaxID=515981 RepID=UPI00351A6BEB|nr:hypothetical protein FG386_003282 [Cryptosporidium ryanae]